MNKKFKRLLSALLAIVMVFSGLQLGGWTSEETVKAASLEAGDTIYLDLSSFTDAEVDSAEFKVRFKNDSTGASTEELWMTKRTDLGDHIYSYTIPEGTWEYVYFGRGDAAHKHWNNFYGSTDGYQSMPTDDVNCYVPTGYGEDGSWEKVEEAHAAFAGQTIFVTGNATVTLSDGTTVTGTQVQNQDGTYQNVYKYTFGERIDENVTFSIKVGDTTYVSGVTSVDSATPCYDTTAEAWVAYTAPIVTVRVYLSASDNVKVYTYDSDSATGASNELTIVTSGDTKYFDYSVIGGKYIRVGWLDNGSWKTGNFTTAISKDEILEHNGETLCISGSYTDNVARKYAWGGFGDASLNIPSGEFKKETGAYYVYTTFYDYYSDVELTGVNRNTLTDGFDYDDGSDDKIQARTFNEAVSAYFNGRLSGTSFKPLYFGEFTKASQSYYLYDENYNNVKGGVDGSGAHQGLIDSTLNSDKNATMNGIELPYFNEEFLRGENSANQAIGQVFENVQFPFAKNDDDYWEFDSAKASQTLRMKQDSKSGTYYLDRVGENGAVYGATSEKARTLGFFPFNDTTDSAGNDGNPEKLNYAFGVRFDIPFTMTADGKYGEEGEGKEKKDIVYNFSGDDDVWVFIDGQLVLDIGGDHGKITGQINFATDNGTMTATVYKANGTTEYTKKTYSRPEANKQHTLTMFYMERGLWESNMKITFNFPQINTFAVNMEVDASNVNALFADIVKEKLSGFDVLVQNYATRGTDLAGATITETEKTYNSLDSEDSSTIYSEGSPEQIGILTSTTDSNNKSGREDVLLVKYKAQLKDTADANGHRVIIYPEEGTTFDASSVSDYLQFDMYNEGKGSTGVPYVYLVDKSGNKICGWASSSVAYNGNNNTLTRNNWVTVQVDLAKLKGTQTFNFNEITEIRIGYWDSGYTYIDNITFHKEATTETEKVEFKTPQYDVPTYGSIKANELVNATGAIYKQQRSDDTTSQSYVIGTDGKIRLSNGDTALFTDQFRIGSYINLEESVDSNYFTTRWELSEGGSVYSSGDGNVIDDNRTELAEYAAETVKDGTALMTLNSGVTQPESALLYRSYARTDDVITPTHIEATFYNSVNVGSLKIQKKLENLEGGEYTFKITFSNVMGIADTKVETTVTLNASNGYCETIEDIPVGTNYVIEEVIPEDAADVYTVTNIEHTSGNDSGSGDVANKKYAGILSLGAEDVQDVITFTNAPIPVTVDKVFFVESETETTLPMDLEELSYFDEVAVPDSSEEASIFLQEGTTTDADGNVVPDNNVKFDAPYVNEDEETEPSKSVPNEKYTFTYSGKDNNGTDADGNPTTRLVTGTVTIYTFKAYNDVYVFDYGLKSDLADTTYGSGLFQNDTLFNEKVKEDRAEKDVKDTTAAFTGFKKKVADTEFTNSISNDQSTITGPAIGTALNQIGDTNAASLPEDEEVIFQPTAFMDEVEIFYYQASVYAPGNTSNTINDATEGVNLTASVRVMPASVVYYEDNFNASNSTTTDGSLKIIYTNSASATDPTDYQSNDQEQNYGYDKVYTDDLTVSGGSATEMSSGDGAYFTFTGTGFDIISRTNSNTAGLVAYVYQGAKDLSTEANIKAAGSPYKTIFVDTFYSNGDLYQVPVISTTLSRGTYTVYLKAASTYTGQSVIYIDGVRIYNPLNSKDSEDYYLSSELNTTVEELRGLFTDEQINLVEFDNETKTIISMSAGTAVEVHVPNGTTDAGVYLETTTVSDIIAMGPNNELYMPLDKGIAFTIAAPTGEDWTLQVGAKSVSADEGSVKADKQFTVWVKPEDVADAVFTELGTYTINTSTDMYYDLDLSALITEQGWTASNYAVAIVNSTKEYNDYDIISFTTIKHSSSVPINVIGQTTTTYATTRTVQQVEPVIQSAKFDISSVTRGKYAGMTVVTASDVEDVKVYDPDGTEVTSFYKKVSSVDADGNKVWNLTFKVIKVKGDAVYSVKAVVDDTVSEESVSAVIAIK